MNLDLFLKRFRFARAVAKNPGKKTRTAKGFTLIEFIVIIVIFTIVAAVSLFDFKGFTQRIRIENLAQNVALIIREAQVLGSTRTALHANPADLQFTGYVGVYIPWDGSMFGNATLPDGQVLTNSFAVYRDDANNQPDHSIASGDTLQDILKLDSGDSISTIEAGGDPSSLTPVSSDFYILFKRPSLNAVMYSTDEGIGSPYQYALITVRASDGETRQIKISAGGEISVVQS